MRTLMLIALASTLAGCGSKESEAVAACKAEIQRKVENANFALDEADMAAKARREGENVVRIQSTITFDPGLPKEVKQSFDCRARVSADGADVIALQFIW
jgi:hypothetical protein